MINLCPYLDSHITGQTESSFSLPKQLLLKADHTISISQLYSTWPIFFLTFYPSYFSCKIHGSFGHPFCHTHTLYLLVLIRMLEVWSVIKSNLWAFFCTVALLWSQALEGILLPDLVGHTEMWNEHRWHKSFTSGGWMSPPQKSHS